MDGTGTPTGPRPTASATRRGERLQVRRGPAGEVVLAGEIDAATATILHQVLDAAVRQAGPLVVDLCGVLYLEAAGVAVLHEHAGKTDLRLRVRSNSALATVTRICGLTHLATVELVPGTEATTGP